FTRATFIYPVKSFKETGYIFFFYSLPIICNPYDYLIFNKVFYAYFCCSPILAIFYRVYNKVGKYLLDTFSIGKDINRFFVFHIKSEGNVFFSCFHLKQVKSVLYYFGNIEIFKVKMQISRFKFGDHIKIFNNKDQSFYTLCGTL